MDLQHVMITQSIDASIHGAGAQFMGNAAGRGQLPGAADLNLDGLSWSDALTALRFLSSRPIMIFAPGRDPIAKMGGLS
jgi:hypothetical protein